MHAAAVPRIFKTQFPGARVDWLVRADLRGVVQGVREIDQILEFDRKLGFFGLIKAAWRLGAQDYTHVYDAHSNVRSFFVTSIMKFRTTFSSRHPSFIRRSKERLNRWLLFKWRINKFPSPYRSAESFLRPLAKWNIPSTYPAGSQVTPQAELPDEVLNWFVNAPGAKVALAPSAAWEMKRWPVEYWRELITKLPDFSFALLGGAEDTFFSEIVSIAPERCLNLAGKLSLAQSTSFLARADLVIANDTGSMHVADQLGRPTIALIGPTAFGYPSNRLSRTLEVELWCKPCSKDGRGKCVNDLYKRCLKEISPNLVASTSRALLSETKDLR